MSELRDFCERAWQGEIDTVHDSHPVMAAWRGRETDELLPDVLYFKGMASATTIDTGDGLVMLDTGAVPDTESLHQGVRAWRSDPLVAAVFSHHHLDHIWGVRPFRAEAEQNGTPEPRVYGHEAIGKNFDRYKKTRQWNGTINRRQFLAPGVAIDQSRPFPEEYPYPDVTYAERLSFKQGGLTFELRHCRGETEDATWTWVPEKGLLFTGDLFIWATPNAGNPQKVQRYVGEWSVGLREMASRGAEVMVPGHGWPIFGAGRVREALVTAADFLEDVETQVLELMNTGASLNEVLHRVKFQDSLLLRPYLRPVYDHPQFLIRNIWRLYGGWYDGEPDNLLPAPKEQLAQEWVDLAGGIDRVLTRVESLLRGGDTRMACHLIEAAVLATPDSQPAHELRTRVYEERARLETASMSRNLFLYAAESSRAGRKDGFQT